MRATSLKVLGPAIAIAVVVGFAGDARAQGVYLGGAYGWTDIDIPVLGGSWDHSSGYKLFLGYEFPKILGLEAAWVNLGGHHEWMDGMEGELHSDGWTAALTGRIPITKSFTVYGKVGYFFWNTQFEPEWDDVIETESNKGEDPFYGFGVRFDSGKFSFLGEYEHYSTSENANKKLFAFGVRFTF
jgi:OOP family OmpA-OmpF porin